MDDDFLRDLFARVGPVTIKRMFGGKGVMAEGSMLALVAFDTVFIKVDGLTEERFRQAGSRPFAYRRSTRSVTVPAFWSLPEEAFDDPEAAARWAELGREASLRAAAKRKAKPSRRRQSPVPADLGVDVAPRRTRREKV